VTTQLLKNAYDIHVHAAPDVIPRATGQRGLALAASEAGMSGILLKDHCTSTVGRVDALNSFAEIHCRFYSALALNPPVGSLNPVAVESALRAGVDVIFFLPMELRTTSRSGEQENHPLPFRFLRKNSLKV